MADVALRRWRESEETTDWIGEWHSHPQAILEPSSIDLNSWRSMTDERGAAMAFVIVGYEALWAGICCPGLSLPVRYVETEQSPDGTAFQAA